MKKLLRVLAPLVFVAMSSAASANQSQIASQDASFNLYTASRYPTSAKLRVSKRSADNVVAYVRDITIATGYALDTYRYPYVQCDANGNVFVAAMVYKTGSTYGVQLGIFEVTASGTTYAKYYNPAPGSSASMSLAGITVDSSGNFYVLGNYNTNTSTSNYVPFLLKYTPTLATAAVQGIYSPYTTTTYYVREADVVADGSGNVYVASTLYPYFGPGSVGVSMLTKFNASFSGTAGTSTITQPSDSSFGFGGSLTIGPGGRLTYFANTSLNDGTGNLVYGYYATQWDTSGAATWSAGLPMPGLSQGRALVDSSGDLVVSGIGTTTSYFLAKVSATSPTTLWSRQYFPSQLVPNGYALAAPQLCQDPSGDYLAALSLNTSSTSATNASVVDRVAGTTGNLVSSSLFANGNSNRDYGVAVFPWSTTGTFFVAGVGYYSGTGYNKYYPLTYRSGSSPWADYQRS